MSIALAIVAGLFALALWADSIRHVGGGWVNDVADLGELAAWPLGVALVVLCAVAAL